MSSKKRQRPANTQVDGLLAARICLVLAIVGAGYLAALALSGRAVAGCGPESSCHDVLSSRWASWLGVPVSVPALALYAALLGLSFQESRNQSEEKRRRRWRIIIALSGVILGAAAWFTVLQAGIVGSWCKFCLATHLSASMAAVLFIRAGARVVTLRTKKIESRLLGTREVSLTALIAAVIGLAILGTGQVAVQKQLYAVTATPSEPTASVNVKQQQVALETETSARSVSLHNGQFKLDPEELPVLGSPSAPNVIVSLFDYTCHYCRDLHHLLKEAEEKYAGQLCVISVPMPLDGACNPYVSRTPPAHENACRYAKYGLAVWLARREAFREFDDWLFASATPPPLPAVREKAEALVGKTALDRALADPWVARQLGMGISLYAANRQVIGSGRMPQIIMGSVIADGPVPGLNELLRLVEQHTSLRARDSIGTRMPFD